MTDLKQLCRDAIAYSEITDSEGRHCDWRKHKEYRDAAAPQRVLDLLERVEMLENVLKYISYRYDSNAPAVNRLITLREYAGEALNGDKP